MIIAVTADKYEFIAFIEDSPSKIAKKVGVNSSMVRNALCYGYKEHSKSKCGYRFYKISEDDNEND